MKKILILAILFVLSSHQSLWSSNKESSTNNTSKFQISENEKRNFYQIVRNNISAEEQLVNAGLVYAAQWCFYLIQQKSTIEDRGSFENWYKFMYKPHFDQDSYDYNLAYHSLAGAYYYLFYRSRGYTKPMGLQWSIISSLLFEFTVETITEQPSYQDMYQTPVLGAIVGMTLEYLSCRLLSSENKLVQFLGYLLNPFAILPFSSYSIISTPIISEGGRVLFDPCILSWSKSEKSFQIN